MKKTEVVNGGRYHDGKVGVREVVSITAASALNPARVTYRILAAKVEQEYSYTEKKIVTTIGSTSSCDITSFAQWAKTKLSEIECQQLLVDLAAKKLRLAPGEKAFMASVAKEYSGADGQPQAGCTVSFSFNETRQARGVEKKGIATVSVCRAGSGGEITLTALGASWIRAHCAAPV